MTGVINSTSGTPVQMLLAPNAGTYNRTVIYHALNISNAFNGTYIDLARTSDSISATPTSFYVASRGYGPGFTVTPKQTGAGADVTASSFTPSSDARLKRNVQTMTNALRDVQKLRPVTFDWIADGKPSLGFIAQEVEKVFPHLVARDPQGYKTLDYDKITAILTAAFQESRTQDALQFNQLKAENAALRERLDRLEMQVKRIADAGEQRRHSTVITRAP
jgi:hypothetical protein